MAKTILSKSDDAEPKRPTEMRVGGEAGQVVAPPAEVERPLLRLLRIAAMVLFGISMYTLMLMTILQGFVPDPCMRSEVVKLLKSVVYSMNAFTALLGLVYVMLYC